MLFLLRFLSFLVRLLPRKMALGTGNCLGVLFKWASFRRWKTVRRNLDLFYGDFPLPEARYREILDQMYRNLGKNMIEFMRLPLLWGKPLPDWIEVEGEANLRAAQTKNKSIILILGHIGCWDMLSIAFNLVGGNILIATKQIRNRGIQTFWEKYRSFDRIRMIDKKNSSRQLMQGIKQGVHLGFPLDQNMNPDNGVFVRFGSEFAGTLSAPAVLARRFQLPVITAYAVRLRGDRYRVIFLPEIPVQCSEDSKADIIANTQAFSDSIEEVIRLYPEQWIWMHRRWKSRPEGAPACYD